MAIDFLQLHEGDLQILKNLGIEKILAVIIVPKNFPFLAGDHRRDLIQVADEDHLDAAEGSTGGFAIYR